MKQEGAGLLAAAARLSGVLREPPLTVRCVFFLFAGLFSAGLFALAAPHNPSLQKIGAYNALLAKNPDDVAVLRARGSTYRALELYDDALGDFERAEKLAPGNAETVVEMGICHYMLGESDEALAVLERGERLFEERAAAGKWDPETGAIVDRELRETLMNLYRERGDYEKALSQWDKLKKYLGGKLAFRCDRADLLLKLGKVDEAMKIYEDAVEFNPVFERFCVGAANCYLLTGYEKRALAVFDKWAAGDPDCPLPHMFRSLLLKGFLKDPEGARKAGEKAVALARKRSKRDDPPDFDDLIMLARVLQATGAYEESSRLLDEFMEFGRGHYLVVHLQAGNLRALGRKEEADSLEAEAGLYRRLNPKDWLQAYELLTPGEVRAARAGKTGAAAKAGGGNGEKEKGRSGGGGSGIPAPVFWGAGLAGAAVLLYLILRALRRR